MYLQVKAFCNQDVVGVVAISFMVLVAQIRAVGSWSWKAVEETVSRGTQLSCKGIQMTCRW